MEKKRFYINDGNIYTIIDNELRRLVEKFYAIPFDTAQYSVAGFDNLQDAKKYIKELGNSKHPEELFAFDPALNWIEVPGTKYFVK